MEGTNLKKIIALVICLSFLISLIPVSTTAAEIAIVIQTSSTDYTETGTWYTSGGERL